MALLTSYDMELALRLGLSMLFGVLIGIERQWHHKNAGLKTNTLVAVGSAAFAMMSAAGFGPNNNPAQVAAGVVTGIGFIGGGVIMRRGSSVQGINTAATLWATASMGLAIGIGYYKLGCFILVTVLSSQFFLRWGAKIIDDRSGMVLPATLYSLSINFSAEASGPVQRLWSEFNSKPGIAVQDLKEVREQGAPCSLRATFALSSGRSGEIADLGAALSFIEGVSRAEWSQSAVVD